MSVPRMATTTRANGVRARRPASRTVRRVPAYDSVTGQKRRISRTLRSDSTSTAWSWCERASRSTLTAVASRTAPKRRKVARERGDQLGAEGDEDAAQHQRSGDPDEEHSLLELLGHRERREQEHEDEEVVDRQRLLDEVARVVLEPVLAAVRSTRSSRRRPPGSRCRRPTSPRPPSSRPRAGAG